MNQSTNMAIQDEHQQETAILPLSLISICEGLNPRRYFPPKEANELEESIRSKGIVQAITVFPNPDEEGKYFVMAGERRFRAANTVNLSEVPVLIRHIDKQQARILAVVENMERVDMSALEEAESARVIVSEAGGDKDEAAKLLGWSRKVLDARLLLLTTTDEVKEALLKGEIKLGHAELFATLPANIANKTLPRVIEFKTPVGELRDKLAAHAHDLSAAPFNTDGCAGCSRNSSTTHDLLSTVIASGNCTDHECWNTKRNEGLELTRTELKDQYAMVAIEDEREPETFIIVQKSGTSGVGGVQLKACQACTSFGAILSKGVGEEGKVKFSDVCFDISCHKGKVAAYQELISGEANAPVVGTEQDANDLADKSSDTAAEKNPESTTTNKKKAAPKAENKGQSKAVIELVNTAYKDAAGVLVMGNLKAGLVYAAWELGKSIGKHKSHQAADAFGISVEGLKFCSTSKYTDTQKMFGFSEELLNKLIRAFAGIMTGSASADGFDNSELKAAHGSFSTLGGKIEDYFQITQQLLEGQTKPNIRLTLEDANVGFDKWYNEKMGDEKAFNSLANQKKPDLIKAVMEQEFEWEGKVPGFVKEIAAKAVA